MDLAKKIFDIAIIIITIVAVFSVSLFIYFSTIGKSKLPTGITSTYATTITDPQTKEELPVLEANYYNNKNNTGYEVVEFRVNAYSGVSKQGVYSRGFQMVWDTNGKLVVHTDETTGETSNVWYYDSYDNVSFETGHEYEWGDPMIIDIDGKTYAVSLDGKYTTTHSDFDGWKLARTISCIGLNFIFEDTNMYNTYTTEHKYTFEDLLLKIRQIVRSSSNGTGDNVISLIDLGDFLHIYELNDDGSVMGTPIGGGTDNTLINSYFTMATHYDNRGMAWTKQSLFGSVAGDSQFNITGLTENVEYWKSSTLYNLSEADFEDRYSTIDNGFYYVLPTAKINELKNYENIEIHIIFNVANLNVNVLGLDYYALNGIEVSSLIITSTTQRDFTLMVGSLKDTGLTSATIHTTNINLVNNNSGVTLS